MTGLVDDEIKEDILGWEDKTLEDTVKTVEAKESAKCAKAKLGEGQCQVSKVPHFQQDEHQSPANAA